MKPIQNEVNQILRKVFRRQHPILAELIINWDKIVGIKFSKTTEPVKITTSKEKGAKTNILQVKAYNASISVELSFMQDVLIERIALYLGYKGVHKIRIIVQD